MYYLGSRYYDSTTGRFISLDREDVIAASPMGLTDKNLYAYCDNNPITRVDKDGEFWVFANVVVGLVAGAASKIVSNLLTNKTWNEGVVGAAIGGAVYGAVLSTTGNIAVASFTGALAESITNETLSYTSLGYDMNGEDTIKDATTENVAYSLLTVTKDTLVNGTVSTITGRAAAKIVPTNNGWFKPKKFLSSFIGPYARKAHLQTFIQAGLTVGVNCYHEKGLRSIRPMR